MFKKIARRIGISLLTILALILLTYFIIYQYTESRINRKYDYEAEEIVIPSDSISIIKGEHLYQIRGCEDCHGKQLQGSVFMNDATLMKITAPNLIGGRGGLPADYSVKAWVRVIRHGTDKNGQSLFMMPSQELFQLSNEDLANIIAYCKAQPPAGNPQQKMHTIGPLGRILMALDKVTVLPAEKIDHYAIPPDKMEENDVVAKGRYLSTGCHGCHRNNMQGGDPLAPGFPPVPDITSRGHLRNWNASSFIGTLKTGNTPEGKLLDNQYMPWQSLSNFTEDEMTAIFHYLKSLPGEQ